MKKIYKFLLKMALKMHSFSYKLISFLSIKYEDGLHPKHRLIGYHEFFMHNVGKEDSVLDIGCGNGSLAKDVAKCAKSVMGIDFDPKVIEKAKRLVDGLKRVAIENEIPLQVNTRGSMFGFFFCEKEPKNFKEVGLCNFERFATFHREMLKRGFYFACSQYEAGFICTKITNKMIDDCIKAADEVMKGLK